MRKYEGKLIGILGTIIVHLVVALIFMSVKLSSLYHEKSSEFLVEFQPEERFIEDNVVEVPKTLEQLFEDDDRFRDIIRNIANPPEVTIDADEYVDRVKEELIESGRLGEDNFIDEKKNALDEMESGDTAVETADPEKKPDEKVSSNEMAAMYQGPTRIFYDLKDRHHIEMPIPIYKCVGSGIIVIKITVNPRGLIIDSKQDVSASSTSDPCLAEAAADALKRTRFNPDENAPSRQEGTITYHFVAQ